VLHSPYPMSAQKRKIIRSIFIAKGICILLVVAGHYRPAAEPRYWVDFYTVRHQFTMPLFFLLSGYLFRYVSTIGGSGYFRIFFRQKVPRLVYPYLVISLLLFVAKYLAGLVYDLQHPASLRTVVDVFVNPIRGHATMLWFIYTLSLVFIVYPLLRMLLRSDWLVLAATIALMYAPSTEYCCIKPLFDHLPFFVFGILLVDRIDFDETSARWNVAAILAGSAVFVAMFIARESVSVPLGRLVLGISGSLVVIALSSLLARPAVNAAGLLFEKLGFYSMSIYLFHTFVLGASRIVMYQVLDISGYFAIGALIAIAAATAIPLFLERDVLRKVPVMRRYILGLKPASRPAGELRQA